VTIETAAWIVLDPVSSANLGVATGVAATIISCAIALPQTLRIWRLRSYRGVSVLMWALLSVGMSTWIGYGYLRGNYTLAIANTVTTGQALLLLLGVARASSLPSLRKFGIGAVLALACVTTITIGYLSPPVLVAALLATPPFIRLGQIGTSWRNARTRAASDVSIWTWSLMLVTSALWTLHGVFVADPLVAGLSLIAALGAVVVVGLEVTNRRRRGPHTA